MSALILFGDFSSNLIFIYYSSYPHTNNKIPVFSKFASKIQSFNNELESCSNTPAQLHQNDLIEEVTNIFYKSYKVPLFTMQLGCCKMPNENSISGVWRKNIHKMLNFLKILDTGVKGFVKNIKGEPIRNALIKIEGNIDEYKVTENQAHFRIVLPSGKMTIVISSSGYTTKRIEVLINENLVTDLGDVILNVGDGAVLENNLLEASSPTEGTSVIFNSSGPLPLTDRRKPLTGMGTIDEPGVINGFVLDTANHPLSNAKVFIDGTNASTFTDPLGVFKLFGVPPGDAILTVQAPRHIMDTR